MDTPTNQIKTPAEMLVEHLAESRTPQGVFATRIGIGQGSLSKLCRGLIRPRLKTAVAIEQATDGLIPAASWVAPPSSE